MHEKSTPVNQNYQQWVAYYTTEINTATTYSEECSAFVKRMLCQANMDEVFFLTTPGTTVSVKNATRVRKHLQQVTRRGWVELVDSYRLTKKLAYTNELSYEVGFKNAQEVVHREILSKQDFIMKAGVIIFSNRWCQELQSMLTRAMTNGKLVTLYMTESLSMYEIQPLTHQYKKFSKNYPAINAAINPIKNQELQYDKMHTADYINTVNRTGNHQKVVDDYQILGMDLSQVVENEARDFVDGRIYTNDIELTAQPYVYTTTKHYTIDKFGIKHYSNLAYVNERTVEEVTADDYAEAYLQLKYYESVGMLEPTMEGLVQRRDELQQLFERLDKAHILANLESYAKLYDELLRLEFILGEHLPIEWFNGTDDSYEE